jgi:hypothetical protein
MIKMISLNWHKTPNEVKPRFLARFKKQDSVIIKLDFLQDAIYYLTEEYNKTLKNKDIEWTYFDNIIEKQGTRRWKFKKGHRCK